jgi:hypothetical protein
MTLIKNVVKMPKAMLNLIFGLESLRYMQQLYNIFQTGIHLITSSLYC